MYSQQQSSSVIQVWINHHPHSFSSECVCFNETLYSENAARHHRISVNELYYCSVLQYDGVLYKSQCVMWVRSIYRAVCSDMVLWVCFIQRYADVKNSLYCRQQHILNKSFLHEPSILNYTFWCARGRKPNSCSRRVPMGRDSSDGLVRWVPELNEASALFVSNECVFSWVSWAKCLFFRGKAGFSSLGSSGMVKKCKLNLKACIRVDLGHVILWRIMFVRLFHDWFCASLRGFWGKRHGLVTLIDFALALKCNLNQLVNSFRFFKKKF